MNPQQSTAIPLNVNTNPKKKFRQKHYTVSRSKTADIITKLGRTVSYYPLLTQRLDGSIGASLMFSQLLYWTGRGKDPEGWIFKSADEFEEETGLSRRQQETARKILKDAGLIEEKLKGCPPVLHFRIDTKNVLSFVFGEEEKIIPFVSQESSQKTSLTKNADPISPKGEN